MKIFTNIFLAGLLTCFLSGIHCRKQSNPVDNNIKIKDNSDGLTPLKIGNKWIYRFCAYDTSGVVIATFLDTIVVKKDTVIKSERWYNIPRFKPADVDFLDYYTNKSDGIWVLRRVIGTNYDTAYAYLTFKYPAAAGDFWGTPFGDSARVLSTTEVINTPWGKDTCIKYEDYYQLYSSDGIIFYYYFAPGKGWITFEIYTKTNSGYEYLVNKLSLVEVILH